MAFELSERALSHDLEAFVDRWQGSNMAQAGAGMRGQSQDRGN